MKNQVSSGDSKRFSLKLTVNCLPWISFESSIRKKYKFSSLGDILHISAKLQGICKMWCWLTEEFDGVGKLINVV